MPREEGDTVSKSKEMLVGLLKMLSGFCFKYYKQFCLSLFKIEYIRRNRDGYCDKELLVTCGTTVNSLTFLT